jgi:hypothetical protein
MKESKSDLLIKFSGRIDNLLIKHKGRVILDYKGYKDPAKEPSPGYLRNQGKLGVTSSFAKAVNSIPILKAIWHKSYFKKSLKTRYKVDSYARVKPGKAVAFNKIIAANNKFSGDENPTVNNIIIPQSMNGFTMEKALLHKQGINFTIPPSPQFFDFPNTGITLTAAAVICAYNPKRRANKKYELIPKYYILGNFEYTESTDISMAFEPEEAEKIYKYKNIILYFTLIVISGKRDIIKWSSNPGFELVERKGAEKIN